MSSLLRFQLGCTYDYGGSSKNYNKNEEVQIDVDHGSIQYNELNK